MSRSKPPATSHTEPRAFPAPPAWVWIALVILAGAAAVYRSDDNDYWFHIAAGRSIAQHGLPSQEAWCLAAKGEKPWLSEWLFHLGLYEVRSIGGDVAVGLWRAGWTAAAMAMIVWILHLLRAATWSGALVSLLALAVARDRFHARPEQIFTVLVLLAVALFERARLSGKDHTRWLIPAQILWANVQGSWVFGPVVAWLYASIQGLLEPPMGHDGATAPASSGAAASILASDASGAASAADATIGEAAGAPPATSARPPAWWQRWALLGLVLWAASAVVPLPLETLARPFRFLGDLRLDPMTSSIDELRRWAWSEDRREPFTAFLALFGIAFALGGRRPWRTSPALSFFALLGLLLGLMGVRFRGFAAWIAIAPIALALAPSGGRLMRAARLGVAAAAGIAGVTWLVTAPQFTPGVEPQWHAVPVRAVALADSLELDGPVLNTFHYGGYMLWARGDSHPPLVDGRGRGSLEFRAQFMGASTEPYSLDKLLVAWDFNYAILQPPRDANDRLAIMLSHQLEWALVFYDDAGLLFVRRARYPQLEPRAYRFLSPDYSTMTDLGKRALADPGLGRLLEAELERARADSPAHARASLWLALLHLARANAAAALPLLDEVERLAPATPGLALRQGLARQSVGDLAGARTAFRRALREPDDATTARGELERLK